MPATGPSSGVTKRRTGSDANGSRYTATGALERSDVRLEPAGSTGPEAAYPTPERIALRGPGVEGAVVLGPERVRADPMRIVPQPFRWFLSREIAPRRILAEGRLRLQVAGEAEPFEAPALVGVTWTHPVSRKGAL